MKFQSNQDILDTHISTDKLIFHDWSKHGKLPFGDTISTNGKKNCVYLIQNLCRGWMSLGFLVLSVL